MGQLRKNMRIATNAIARFFFSCFYFQCRKKSVANEKPDSTSLSARFFLRLVLLKTWKLRFLHGTRAAGTARLPCALGEEELEFHHVECR